jgi:sensor histidine kinase regulating citrate/malate metabolism
MKKKAAKRKQGVRETYETRLRRKNGEIIWVSASTAPVLDEHGSIIGSVGIITNIMQRKKDEEMLESISRFPGENPFPVLRYSIENQSFIYNNSAGEALIKFFKLKKNKTVKMHWEELINSAFKKKTTITDELSVKGKTYNCIIVPIPELNYVNVYANDITERKELEDKMTWQFMKLEKYAFVTSHQLRRPIATILGLVNIFDYENPDAAFNMEVLEKFKIAAQEMDSVTRETVELLVADEFLDEE